MPNQYEIEIKSLLGGPENATRLKKKIREKGGVLLNSNKQLNHYFIVFDIKKFRDNFSPRVEESKKELFRKVLDEGGDFSIRTRDADGKVILVVKASIGSDTSANGVSRMEFESEMKMTLDELDKLLLNLGFEYQAKWSREREEYKLGGTNICLDKNAGYGYLAEFERVVGDQTLADVAKRELVEIMEDFGAEELSQARLERMFAHYNENWRDYYGTDRIFNIA